MGTTLDTGTQQAASPSLKLLEVGDQVKFAVVDFTANVPMTKFGTDGEPDLNRNGKQKTQHILTVLLLDGNGHISDEDGPVKQGKYTYSPAPVDEVYNIFISSYAKYDPTRDKTTAPWMSWAGCTDKVKLEVGSIGAWKYLEDIDSGGSYDRKDRKFQLRAAKPDEADIVTRCEALYAERKADQAAAEYVEDSGPFDDEPAF